MKPPKFPRKKWGGGGSVGHSTEAHKIRQRYVNTLAFK